MMCDVVHQQVMGPIVLKHLTAEPEKYEQIYSRDGILIFRRK
jgi:hypothetical protein